MFFRFVYVVIIEIIVEDPDKVCLKVPVHHIPDTSNSHGQLMLTFPARDMHNVNSILTELKTIEGKWGFAF